MQTVGLMTEMNRSLFVRFPLLLPAYAHACMCVCGCSIEDKVNRSDSPILTEGSEACLCENKAC